MYALRKTERGATMLIIGMILGLILIFLIYVSNRTNNVNKWFAFAGLFCIFGISKEIYLINVMPYLENTFGETISQNILIMPYNLQAWIAFNLTMPVAVLASLYFYGMDTKNPKLLRFIGISLFVPILILSFLFSPLALFEHEIHNPYFWHVYSAYNLALCMVFVFFIVKSVLNEKNGHIRIQKLLVALVVLPLIIYSVITVYIAHPLGIAEVLNPWAGIVLIILLCILVFIYMAFRNGMMGLSLSKDTYNWNSEMSLVSKGAEYTSHILKNQIDKMEWCIDNLKTEYSRFNAEESEELLILSRSLSTLKDYMNKIKKYSKTIVLSEENVNLKSLIENSLSLPNDAVEVHWQLPDEIYLLCDKTHMSEVFINIISNACDAIRVKKNSGTITIKGEYDANKRYYLISITDDGAGMSNENMENMFKPYFTTKNPEKNFGIGLTYCKNAIEKHEGSIKAESRIGEGTTMIIALPVKRINGGEKHV